MKKYIKTFGEIPEEVTILSTKVFFDQEGIALVEDDVAEVLDQVPGYSFVADVSELTEDGEALLEQSEASDEVPKEHEGVDDPENVSEGTPIEEPVEDDSSEEVVVEGASEEVVVEGASEDASEDADGEEDEVVEPKPKTPARPRRPAPIKK